MLFADIAPDAPMIFVKIVPDIFALPRTSRATVGIELPMPIRALPPPTKYKLFAAERFVPN